MDKYKIGKVIKGIVTGVEKYGIFISFDEYYTGLIHISEISHSFVKNINEIAKVGDNIYVKILDIDEDNFKLKLSIKDINYKNIKKNRTKEIVETSMGFKTLELKLPEWIELSLKKIIKHNK